MIEHVGIHVSNYKKAKKFYIAALKPLGYKNNMEHGEAAGFMEGGHTSFWIAKKAKVVPMHVAFAAKSKKEVQKFHAAALKAGAKDNGGPGFRTDYGPTYYASFVLDADKNNIEACYFGARAPKA